MVNKLFDKIKRAVKLDIVKVFSLTSMSTMVRMAAGFISVKVVAVIIGPSGVAMLGQLSNFSSIIMHVANGGITSGVTKYVAQYKDDADTVKSYIGTAIKITLFLSAACGLFLILGSSYLGSKILLDAKYGFVFIVFGVTLVSYTCKTLLMAIINGYKQFRLFVRISIISTVVGLMLSLALVIPFGLNGALLNAVTSQSLTFSISLFLAKRAKVINLSIDNLWGRFDKAKAMQYFRFSCMSLVTAFTGPITQLIIRGYIIDNFSMDSAGCWDGMKKLSHIYLMVITSSFSVYYLPKLSETLDPNNLRREIKRAYKIIIPCLLVGLPIIYFCRNIIITILFSPKFYPMADLFLWVLIADLFKISSWLIAYLMFAKAMTKLFIATEIIFSASYVGFAFLFGNMMGLQGVVLGYAVNFLLYFIVMWIGVYKRIGR